MWWIALALAAVFAFTVGDLIDKFIVTKEVTDPYLAVVLFGFLAFLVFTLASLSLNSVLMDWNTALAGLNIGLVSTLGLWFYFSALSREEVSRAVPILGTVPLFVLPFGFFFFEESFTIWRYLGVGLVVLGSFSLSFHESNGTLSFDKVILLVFLTALLFAFRNVLIKLSTQSLEIWPVLFWVGIGRGASALVVLLFHRPHLRKKARKGARHLILAGSVVAIGAVFFFTAISLGSVSLVSALAGIKPILVLVSATIITLIHPSFIREKLSKVTLIQKTLSTLSIIVGAALIVL